MNKYLVFLKNPKIWFGILLFIGITVSISLIIKALKPEPLPETKLCPLDQTKTTCSDGSITCAPICPYKDMTWNCVSGKCECTGLAQVCGDECCTSCNAEKNACCPDKQVYKDSTGITKCCEAGTKANSQKNGCTDACGELECKEDEECINIEGMKDIQATKTSLENAQIPIPYDNTTDPDIIKFCSKTPNCNFDDEKAEPNSVDSNYFFHNFSKNSLANADSGLNACFPIDTGTTNDNTCYNIFTSDDCTGSGVCKWINLLDDFGDDKAAFAARIAHRNDFYKRSPYGDYCQKGDDMYGRYVQFTGGDSCTVSDCIRQISNKNTVQVGWNETKKTCSALRIPDDNGMDNGMKCSTNAGAGCGKQVQETKTSDWSFKKCDPTDDNMIFNYKGDCTSPSICGNCPFGDNSSYLTDKLGKHGQQDTTGFQIGCYDDGEIKTIPPLPKDPLYKMMDVEHGNICYKCEDGDDSCNLKSCAENTDANCISPYVLNYSKTNCIYPCQIDGQNARDKPNNTGNEQGEKYFNVQKLNGKTYCFRNYPAGMSDTGYKGLCTAYNNNCSVSGYANPIKANITDQNYTYDNICYSYDNKQACFMPIRDNIIQIPTNLDPKEDSPIYMFPRDHVAYGQTHPDNIPTQCWTSKGTAASTGKKFSLSSGYLWSANKSGNTKLSDWGWYDHYPNPLPSGDNFCEDEPKP